MMGSKARVCIYVSLVLGPILVVLGACLKWAIFPALVTSLINTNLKLKPDTEAWDAWITPPVTPFMKFTFFNVTNPQEVREGQKPRVEEIGPFSYIEHREKKNPVSIYEEISYGSYIAYEFDEVTSCSECKINTTVTVINPVMVLVPYLLDKTLNDISNSAIGGLRVTYNETIHDLAVKLIDRVTTNLNEMTTSGEFLDDIVLTGTPDDMIFQGVYSPILAATYSYLVEPSGMILDVSFILAEVIIDACHNMKNPAENPIFGGIYDSLPPSIQQVIDLIVSLGDQALPTVGPLLAGIIAQNVNVTEVLDNMDLPPMIDLQSGTFGFFKGTNATQTYWKINSGKYNLDQYQRVLEFNGNSRLPDGWWPNFGPTPNADGSGMTGVCHDIVGTDGLAFSPGITEEDTLWLFNDQLCRSIWLTSEGKVDVNGIDALRFTPPASVFSFSNPDNYCYCPDIRECAVKENDTWNLSSCERCVDGIISLEGCQGVPVIMSTPHFLDGDDRLWQAIDGLQPQRDEHVTYLHLEPLSGMPLVAHKKIQISLPVAQSDYFDCMNNLLTQMDYNQTELVFPLAWVDEGADIDDENTKKAKGLLVTPFIAVDAVTGILIGVGGLMMIVSVFWCLKSKLC